MESRHDGTHMDALSHSECCQLLTTRSVGRIGVIIDQYPLIIPVNYAMDEQTVVIRTAPGTVVARANQARVTFQVDEFDYTDNSGWSVLMRGQAKVLTVQDRGELIHRTLETGVSPWAPGERDLWIRIHPHGLSGRRIKPGEGLEWPFGFAAYM